MFLNFFGKKNSAKNINNPEDGDPGYGIDAEMNYCPLCGDEYRSDIKDCSACRVVLITGLERIEQKKQRQAHLQGRSMDIVPEDEMVEIRKGGLRDMKYLQIILAEQMIPARVISEEGNCSKGCCGPEMYLQIRKTDMSGAMDILSKDFVKTTALENHDLSNVEAVFDQLAEETVCPACGCKFSPTAGACPECGLCFA